MSLQSALRSLEFDPRALEECEERLFALRGAGRKYSRPVDALPDLAAPDDRRTSPISTPARSASPGSARRWPSTARVSNRLSANLSQKRIVAAGHLEAAVMAELPDMKLERAAFIGEMRADPASPSAAGIDTVEFWVRTIPARAPAR